MADRIKERRIAMDFTQEELAQKLGLQKSAIAKYEKGRVENIKRSIIEKMSELFDCSPAWLMGFDVPMRIETPEQKWDREVNEFFDKINAFDVQLRALGWTYEAKGGHASEQSLEMELSLDKCGRFIDTDNPPLVGCGEKKCEDCAENESYYLFSNGQLSFKVTIDDYSSFVDDSQIFFKERLQQLLKKSMKQMFAESPINSKSYLEPQAAHERTDIAVTDEMRKHDDDLMDNDDFWK